MNKYNSHGWWNETRNRRFEKENERAAINDRVLCKQVKVKIKEVKII